MSSVYLTLPYIFGGIIVVTIIDTLGSIASRRLNFNYGYLAPISLMLYLFIGNQVSGLAGLKMALIASMIVGFYDATMGWKFAKLLKANTGISEEDEKKITVSMNLTAMLFISLAFAFIGHVLK